MDAVDLDAYHAFDDPTQDKLLGLVLALGAEVWVLKDRVMLLEHVLSRQAPDIPAAVEKAAAEPGRVLEVERQRDAFLHRLLRPIKADAALKHV
jgi:hypothetical protein